MLARSDWMAKERRERESEATTATLLQAAGETRFANSALDGAVALPMPAESEIRAAETRPSFSWVGSGRGALGMEAAFSGGFFKSRFR